MRRLFAPSVSHGALLLLLLGFATPGGSAATPSSSAPEEVSSPGSGGETHSSPRAFQGVWYRTPEKRGKISARLASGNLTVSDDSISFESKKISLAIATANVKRIVEAQFPDDPINAWIVVEYDEEGSTRAAAFKDAGLGRQTPAIQAALESTWLAGSPAPVTAPPDKDITLAIEALHTTRLESLTYTNSTVPQNVWKLVFMPGIDDALLRAYRAGDRDDLFRFTLIMVLNRRAVGLTDDEVRRQVWDCMMEAVRKDSFRWVKIEARDALRRLGAEKEVLHEIDTLIKSEGGAEAPNPSREPGVTAPAMAVEGSTGVPGPSSTGAPASWGDVVHDVCVEVETKVFEAEGHEEKSELMAHLVCQIAAAGCRDNPGQDPCQKRLRDLDAHLRASGSSMLFAAAHSGRTDICKTMIGLGSDVNAAVKTSWTPLMIAAAEGHQNTVAALLDAGADPNAGNDLGRTALMFTSRKGFTPIVKELLKRGANPNIIPTDEEGRTALMAAAHLGHIETAEALLRGGADPTVRDKTGNTALSLAEAGGHSELARLLKTAGLDKTDTNC